MQPLFYDSFDRTEADAVLNTTQYPTIFGTASSGVVSDKCKFVATSGHTLGADLGPANYTVEAEINVGTGGADAYTGVICIMARYDHAGAGAHYGFAWGLGATFYPKADGTASSYAIAADKLYLVKSTGTAVTDLTTAATPVTLALAQGTTYRMRISVNGNLIEGYINDVQMITGKDTTYQAPYRPAFGIRAKTSTSGAANVTFNNLCVNPFVVYQNIQIAEDEAAQLIKVSMPATSGSFLPQQLFCYHLATGDWTIEDVPTTCLFTWLSITNQKQVVYGNPSDGKLYVFDTTSTRAGSSFTGSWISNWIKIDGTLEKRVVVEYIQYLVSLAESNNLQAYVEVADDPDDPTTVTKYAPVQGFESSQAFYIGQRGNYVRIGLSAAQSMKIRGAKLTVLQ